jgi:DNA-directed RNA polymerase specialized sigma24 family protein
VYLELAGRLDDDPTWIGISAVVSSFLDTVLPRSYVSAVAELDSLSEAADGVSSADPAVGLRAVRALQRLQERLEAIQVANARAQGWSWQAIADALGVSRQAVHQKYNRRR